MRKTNRTIVEYRVYDLPSELPLMLLHGDQWRISDELSGRLHFHNCLEIGFCRTDSGVLQFEEETIPFRAGDVTVIPRHIPHTTCSQKGTRSQWSYLFMDLTALLSGELPYKSPSEDRLRDITPRAFLFSRAQHPRIHFLANCLLEECVAQRKDWVTVMKSYALALHYELLRMVEDQEGRRTPQDAKSFVLRPVLEHIRSHYMEPTSVKALADICHLSETHFRRLFLSIMGTSPLSFVNATRISQACVLLNTTQLSILAIAEAVGIPSLSSFNRNFQQVMGVSPRQYRNAPSPLSHTPRQKYVLTYKGWLAAEDRPAHVSPAQPEVAAQPSP